MATTTTISEQFRDAFHSKRLTFGPIEKDDADQKSLISRELLNHPENFTLSLDGLLSPKSQKDVQEFLDDMSKARFGVVIYLRDTQDSTVSKGKTDASPDDSDVKRAEPSKQSQPIGFILINSRNTRHRDGSISISLGSEWQNSGYGSEAINWVLDWAFTHGNFHCITIGTMSYNTRAMKVYEKLGFTLDGRLREQVLFNRSWYDRVMYSMLEHEWEALRSGAKQS